MGRKTTKGPNISMGNKDSSDFQGDKDSEEEISNHDE